MQSLPEADLFLVEQLQPDWLPAGSHWRFLAVTAGLLFLLMVLTTAVPVGLALGTETAMVHRNVAAGWHRGLQAGGLVALVVGGWTAAGFMISKGWGFGVTLGVALGLGRWITIWQSAVEGGWEGGMRAGIITTVLAVPILARFYYRREERVKNGFALGEVRDRIRPLESQGWDSRRAWLGGGTGILVGGLFLYCLGPSRGLWFGLAAPLLLAIMFGESGTRIILTTRPNEGIRRSASTALRYGALLALLGLFTLGFGYGVPLAQLHGFDYGLREGIVNGILGLGLAVGMLPLGMMPVLKHVALRWLLVRFQRTPRRFVHFLETAVELQLLRRVGGGYQFEHGELRSYFSEFPLDETYLKSLPGDSAAPPSPPAPAPLSWPRRPARWRSSTRRALPQKHRVDAICHAGETGSKNSILDKSISTGYSLRNHNRKAIKMSRELSIFLSSPMDVEDEIKAAVTCINELNDEPAVSKDYRLKIIRWDSAAPAVAGLSPQEAIHRYAGRAANADIVVCIFARRMGTEMTMEGNRYKSGTYYEFETALRARERRRPSWPQVLLYRLLHPAPPTETAEEKRQFQAVERFWDKDSTRRGLGKTFARVEEFRRGFKEDLRNVLHVDFAKPSSLLAKLRGWFDFFESVREHEQRQRQALQLKVYDFWIKDNLYEFTAGYRLPIPLHATLGAGGSAAPVAELLAVHFHTLQPRLVLLGSEGAGKSFQMLEFANQLLDRARNEPAAPVPVILQLSSWARFKTARPESKFKDWIVTELASWYSVPRKAGRRWVENHSLLLCLDGLDEITVAPVDADDDVAMTAAKAHQTSLRVECLREINEYLTSSHYKAGLVLCCRSEEYRELGVSLAVPKGEDPYVVLLPLSEEQISRHLRDEEDSLSALLEARSRDPMLAGMFQNLFLLKAMTIGYNDRNHATVASILRPGPDPSDRRLDLFNNYVTARFQAAKEIYEQKRDRGYPYTETVINDFLAKLARRMQSVREAKLFLVERLQPDWLPPGTHWRFVSLTAVLLFLFMVLTTALPVGMALGTETAMKHNSVALGWQHGLEVGGLVALVVAGWTAAGFMFSKGWGFGVTLGIALGLCRWITIGFSEVEGGWKAGTRAGLITTTLALPILGALYYLREERVKGGPARGEVRDTIRPLEARGWNNKRAMVGAGIGVLVGCIFWFCFDPARGLGFGLGTSPFLAIMFGQFGTKINLKTKPNQGIRRSASTALRYGGLLSLMGLFAFGFGYGVPLAHAHGFDYGLMEGIVNGLLGLGLAVGMLPLGMMPVMKHAALRWLLVRFGRTPRRFVRFLETVADLHLLRRVGGGYQFEHEELRTYFSEFALDEAYLKSLRGDTAASPVPVPAVLPS